MLSVDVFPIKLYYDTNVAGEVKTLCHLVSSYRNISCGRHFICDFLKNNNLINRDYISRALS
jgi:hypothetical protein